MRSFFHKRFEEEFLSSERLRIKILLTTFLIGSAYSSINYFFVLTDAPEDVRKVMRAAMTFLVAMAIFEFITLNLVKRKIRQGAGKVPGRHQYLNAFIEISSPTVLMYVAASNVPTPEIVLQSPVVYFYFVFIILSTLRLDYRLSVFISILAASEFLLLSIYIVEFQPLDSVGQLQNSFITIFGKSIAIFACGMGAAVVARRIKTEIDKSLEFAERGSHIVNMFGQQISREIVDEMLEGNGAMSSKMMRVCIMFIDIRNFTTYVVGKTPSEIVSYQNGFFSIVIDAVTKHHGVINQFLGDGCMITFGAPVASNNACKDAAAAAKEILSRLSELNRNGVIAETSVGMGIHVGDVVTGNIGTSVRQQYSITGSPVILAARLEQLNKEYKSQILVSSEVMEEIDRDVHRAESLGSVILKGWDSPVEVYKLA